MEKNIVLIFILIAFSLQLTYSQNFQWAKGFGGTDEDASCSIFTDKSGNNYITGRFRSVPAYFGTYSINCIGIENMFITKTDMNGNTLWLKKAGGSDINYGSVGTSIIGNSNNDIYIAGLFPYSGTFDTISLGSFGTEDVFLAKYNDAGHCQWVKHMGGNYEDWAKGICLTNDQNIIVYGGFSSPVAHFDTIDLHCIDPNYDKLFFAKYNESGKCLWAKQSTGSGYGYPSKIITDNSRILLTGSFGGPLIFDGDTVITNLDGDIFVASFKMNGNLNWLKKAGGSYADVANSICLDSSGNSYITGYFVDSATFGTQTVITNSGGGDMFVAKYDSSGNCIWVRLLNCSEGAEGKDIITDGNNGIYVTGYFSGTANFGGNIITALSPQDMFIAKYDFNGNCLGVHRAANAVGYGLSLDSAGKCIITGTFTSSTNFGGINLTGHGNNYDIFLTKMDEITGIDEPNQNTNDKLVIYANPNTGKCNITVPDEFTNEPNLVLSIYNQKGQLIQQQRLVMDENKIKLDLDQEAKGVYTATLSDGRKVYTGRIVFE